MQLLLNRNRKLSSDFRPLLEGVWAAGVYNMFGVFHSVQQSLLHLCSAGITVEVLRFEQLL